MLIEKEVIGPGQYWYMDEQSGLPRKLDVTSNDTRYWLDQGSKMLASGLPVPVPYEHDFTAHPMTPKEKLLNNAGEVKEYRIKDAPDGRKDVLFAAVEIQDPQVKDKIGRSIRWTSPWISSFTDGNGTKWNNVITHLALTTRPRITKQTPFPSVAAALSMVGGARSTSGDMCLSKAGLLAGDGTPKYPVAFSLWSGAPLDNVDTYFSLDELKTGKPDPNIFFNLDRDVFAHLEDKKEYDVVLSITSDGIIEGIALAEEFKSLQDAFAKSTYSRQHGFRMPPGSRLKTPAGPSEHKTPLPAGGGKASRVDGGKVSKAGGGRDASGHVHDAKTGRFTGLMKHAGQIHEHAKSLVGYVVKHASMLGEHIKRIAQSVREGIGNRFAQAKEAVGTGVRHAQTGYQLAKMGVSREDIKNTERMGIKLPMAYKAGHMAGRATSAVGLSVDSIYNKAVEMGVEPSIALSIAMAAKPDKPPKKDDGGGPPSDDGELPPDDGGAPEDALGDQEGDVPEGGMDGTGLPPVEGNEGIMMEELLCDLLQALGVPMPDESNPDEFKRHLYEAVMSKIKELTSQGLRDQQDTKNMQPDQNKPPNQQPNASHPSKGQPNPLIQQEQQPMYMSLEDINKLPDPMKGVALAMYNENVKLRAEMEAARKTTDSLRDAKLKEASTARASRVALLGKMSPRVKADLEAMVATPGMALSMGDGGEVIDPMAQTLAMLEKGLADLPALLTRPSAAFATQPHPTDGEMSQEEIDKLADDLARSMGCPPERKAS